jgi:SAM-dependent methyltransferase
MSWKETKKLYAALEKMRDGEQGEPNLWREFAASVEHFDREPPYHLRGLLREVERARGERPKHEFAILEHGCGGGQVSLILFMLGYQETYGVDIGGRAVNWNTQLNQEFDVADARFFDYDGLNLPFPDKRFDFVFSQQVLEHVAPDQIEAYYREEGRVLKSGGVAFHEVPHRLVPYESHTDSWFVHYLPPSLASLVYRSLGRNIEFVERSLYLRWPWDHTKQAHTYIGETTNLTIDRLRVPIEVDYYDGPAGIRKFARTLTGIPVIGALAGWILSKLMMLETRSTRPSS